jgi:hypothetical protein
VTSKRRPPERFDEELRRAARSMVTEPLPPGTLEEALTGRPADGLRARRTLPGFATAVTTIALLILATAVALAPGGPEPSASPAIPTAAGSPAVGSATPIPSPAPTKGAGPIFRPTTDIVGHVTALGYACNDGQALPTGRPSSDLAVRESALCSTAKEVEPLFAAIIVAESAERVVVRISFKADIVGTDTAAARDAVAAELARLVARSMPDSLRGAAVGGHIVERLPSLERGSPPAIADVAGVRISLERHETGTYIVNLDPPPDG